MRCKPGDLAFIVRSEFPENLRKLVRVEAVTGVFSGVEWKCTALQPLMTHTYIGDMPIGSERVPAGAIVYSQDAALQPIRPGDAPDETLTWAGLPADQKTTVGA